MRLAANDVSFLMSAFLCCLPGERVRCGSIASITDRLFRERSGHQPAKIQRSVPGTESCTAANSVLSAAPSSRVGACAAKINDRPDWAAQNIFRSIVRSLAQPARSKTARQSQAEEFL